MADEQGVLPWEVLTDITDFFTRHPTATLGEAKTNFGNKYSDGELKMIAWQFLTKDS